MVWNFAILPLLCCGQVTLLGKGELPGTGADLSALKNTLVDGSPANRLGGLGSALAAGVKPGEFYFLPDRGPGDGATDYLCRWHQVDLTLPKTSGASLKFKLRKTTFLRTPEGKNIQGLAADLTNRWDPEGMRVGVWPVCVPEEKRSEGPAFFISEEYGPRLGIFQQDGKLVRELPAPEKFRIAVPSSDPLVEEAKNKTGRQPNKGFEGLALDPKGRELWAASQGPLLQDKLAAGGKWVRFVRYDLETGQPNAEFVYPLDSPSCGVSELLWLAPGKFLVLERDSLPGKDAKIKKVYLANLKDATDVASLLSLNQSGQTVRPMAKKLLVDLLSPSLGLAGDRFPAKWEGMCWGESLPDARVLWLASDNDFDPKNNTWVLALKIPEGMLRD